MSELTFAEPFRTHGFLIHIGGTTCQVTKVTGLGLGTVEVVDHVDGGSDIVRPVASGPVKWDPLVLERNMDGTASDQFFRDWFSEMFQLDGESGGSSVRRNGSISKLQDGKEVARFAFYEAFVAGVSLGDLTAGETSLWKMTVTLRHCGIKQVL
jgi:phage tail-like protein